MAIPELLKTIALNRLVDQGVRRIDRFYGTDTDREEDEDKGFGFVSQQRPGGLGSIIGRALAFSLLGPIAGPLAFAAGRGLLSRQQQGLGFSPFGGDEPSPAGIVSGKVQTLDGKIVGFNDNEDMFIHSYAWPGASGSGVFNEDGKLIGYIMAISLGFTEYGISVLEDIVIVVPLFKIDWDELEQ